MGSYRRLVSNTNYGMRITRMFFFDRPAVIKAMNRREHAAMSKIGAHGRRVMKSMMNPATRTDPHSKPGQCENSDEAVDS